MEGESLKIRVAGVFIPVTDLKRSMAWYERILGVQLVSAGEWMAGYKFPHGEALLGLVQVEKYQKVQFEIREGMHNCYFNFETADIDSVHRTFIEKGVEVTDIFGGENLRIFHATDPDGNRFDVVEETPKSPFFKHAAGKESW
jgi:glyoxylase I family protein